MRRKAYVLIDVEKGQSGSVAAELSSLPGIVAADVIFGQHNLVAIIEADDVDELEKIVREEIATADFVSHTQTLLVVH